MTAKVSGWYPGRCKDCAQPGAPCDECESCLAGDACESPRGRCKSCRRTHNAREKARRDERRQAGRCWVCGGRAVRVAGVALSTCPTHREYFRNRASGE